MGGWNQFLPSILGKDLEPKLAKNQSQGMRISLDDNLRLVACNSCSKKILESALLSHSKGCTGPVVDVTLPATLTPSFDATASIVVDDSAVPAVEKTAFPGPTTASVKKGPVAKKRKFDSGAIVKAPLAKKVKTVASLNLDTQCGVKTDTGRCGRAITCKMHSVSMKRAVVGRSTTYDALHAEYQAKSTKKGGGSNVVTTASEKTESFAPEVEIIHLLNVIQTNKPKPYVFNPTPITTLVKNRKKQMLIDVFAKA